MRLVTFTTGNGWRSGIEEDGEVLDIVRLAEFAGWSADDRATAGSVRGLLSLGLERLGALTTVPASSREELTRRGGVLSAHDVRLGPPVPDPGKIVCLGLNYRDHAAEGGITPPTSPMWFAKFANSLIGPTDDIVVPSTHADAIDYEAELAVIIGKRAKRVAAEDALEHIAGAMVFNDVSDRQRQIANQLWSTGKAVDTFGPCGPALVLMDEIDDLQALGIRTWVNGMTVQDGSTSSMIFDVAETISFLTQTMTLEPGDMIATGTPAGVGSFRSPKLFLRPGDVVEVEIDGIGRLRNTVADS